MARVDAAREERIKELLSRGLCRYVGQDSFVVTKDRLPRWSSKPTADEIEVFDGVIGDNRWCEAVRSEWHCPGCNRTAHELIRLVEIRLGGEFIGMGFLARLVRHHCHARDFGAKVQRFSDTVVCSDCNSADGEAKRRLGLPRWFSFSPDEISQFVTIPAHSGQTIIATDVAARLYAEFSAAVTNGTERSYPLGSKRLPRHDPEAEHWRQSETNAAWISEAIHTTDCLPKACLSDTDRRRLERTAQQDAERIWTKLYPPQRKVWLNGKLVPLKMAKMLETLAWMLTLCSAASEATEATV